MARASHIHLVETICTSVAKVQSKNKSPRSGDATCLTHAVRATYSAALHVWPRAGCGEGLHRDLHVAASAIHIISFFFYGHFTIHSIHYNFKHILHNSESIVKWFVSVQKSEMNYSEVKVWPNGHMNIVCLPDEGLLDVARQGFELCHAK